MPAKIDPPLGVNSWLQDEIFSQYQHDRATVDESWKKFFENGSGGPAEPRLSPPAPVAGAPVPPVTENGNTVLQPLRGTPARIAENMAASVSVPLATSQRTIAVKVMDENRRIINQH